MTPDEESKAQKAAFIASLPRRAALLAGVEASCPFDPQNVANTFITRIQGRYNVVQIIHDYAEAMLAVDPGARKAWEKINATVEALSHPHGVADVQRMAAEINRKNGRMPTPNG